MAVRLPGRSLRRDLLIGAACTLVAEVELLLLDPSEVDGAVATHHLLNLLVLPAVALRRVAPVASIAVVSVGFVVQPLLGTAPLATPYLVVLFLLASLGWHASLRTGAALVALVLVCGVGVEAVSNDARWADIVVNTVVIVGAWGALHVIRVATDRRVHAELEADRAARAAVEAERTRIAQDLHDSLAHALTLMVLQAGSARERSDDPVAAEALGSIERGGREALADMHRFLGLIGPRDGEAPGIADLADLAERVRGSGLTVHLEVDDTVPQALPPSVATTVYRVVQEGLTNVVRHSDAREVRVAVSRSRDEVVVEVVDDGSPAPARTAGSGRGLSGLGQRLALFQGSVQAGALAQGWQLEARIPLAGAPR